MKFPPMETFNNIWLIQFLNQLWLWCNQVKVQKIQVKGFRQNKFFKTIFYIRGLKGLKQDFIFQCRFIPSHNLHAMLKLFYKKTNKLGKAVLNQNKFSFNLLSNLINHRSLKE